MHELPLIKSVFNSVKEYAEEHQAKKVTEVTLQIGVLREFIPSYVTHYWNYVSKGTIAEGAELIIEDIPATARCGKCGHTYGFDYHNITEAKCPKCAHDKGFLLSGREVILYEIKVE